MAQVWGRGKLRGRRAGRPLWSGVGVGGWAAASRRSLVGLLQSFWPATTTKTSISSTPPIVMEPNTSRDTRATATMPQVTPPPPLGWGVAGGRGPRQVGASLAKLVVAVAAPFWPEETRVRWLKCAPPPPFSAHPCKMELRHAGREGHLLGGGSVCSVLPNQRQPNYPLRGFVLRPGGGPFQRGSRPRLRGLCICFQ